MRKQELMFGILKQLSARETDIVGEGVVEVDFAASAVAWTFSFSASVIAGPQRTLQRPASIW
jgi:transcription termination factor Rho